MSCLNQAAQCKMPGRKAHDPVCSSKSHEKEPQTSSSHRTRWVPSPKATRGPSLNRAKASYDKVDWVIGGVAVKGCSYDMLPHSIWNSRSDAVNAPKVRWIHHSLHLMMAFVCHVPSTACMKGGTVYDYPFGPHMTVPTEIWHLGSGLQSKTLRISQKKHMTMIIKNSHTIIHCAKAPSLNIQALAPYESHVTAPTSPP